MNKPYEIWSEGYLASGMEGTPCKATFHGTCEGSNFREACNNFFKDEECYNSGIPGVNISGIFHETSPSLWACRLFDNESDARKTFG